MACREHWKSLRVLPTFRAHPLASDPQVRRCAPERSAASAPGNADMDEVIRAKRQQTAGSNTRAIAIKGAREHNLKNINLEIPRDKLVVFTGLSGSGKSSLAFDTIFAEGQRRYIESLSAYARQFLGKFDKPDVDEIEGLSPAISIDQKSHSSNPRSTVATITEIYDYLRVLYARLGKPFCPRCGRAITRQTSEEIVDTIIEFAAQSKSGKNILVLAPV